MYEPTVRRGPRSPSSRHPGARPRPQGLPPACPGAPPRDRRTSPRTSRGSRTGGCPIRSTTRRVRGSASPPRAAWRGRPCRSSTRAARSGKRARAASRMRSAGGMWSGASGTSPRRSRTTASSAMTGATNRSPPWTSRCATASGSRPDGNCSTSMSSPPTGSRCRLLRGRWSRPSSMRLALTVCEPALRNRMRIGRQARRLRVTPARPSARRGRRVTPARPSPGCPPDPRRSRMRRLGRGDGGRPSPGAAPRHGCPARAPGR